MYKRILLKLSGEALAGENGFGLDLSKAKDAGRQVIAAKETGAQIGIVIGGGNFWRGRSSEGIDRVKADQIGMLGTVMNCLYVSEVFRGMGMETSVYTPYAIGLYTEVFNKDKAVRDMEAGKIVFFAGGTGHPYFSTDTGVLLRAIEVDADCVLMAKNIDGVYDSDPAVNPKAKRYDTLKITDVIAQNLQVIDMTASILSRDNHMPLRLFDLNEEDGIVKAAAGKFNGTTVTAD